MTGRNSSPPIPKTLNSSSSDISLRETSTPPPKPTDSLTSKEYRDSLLAELEKTKNAVAVFDKRYYIRTSKKTGLLEKVDIVTGKVVTIQVESFSGYAPGEFSKANYFRYEAPDGEICFIPKAMRHQTGEIGLFPRAFPFNPIIAEEIISRISKGETITKIITLPHMPTLSILHRWRKNDPEFDKAIKEARLMRREMYQDKVADSIDDLNHLEQGATTRERIAIAKLRKEALLELSKHAFEEIKVDKKLKESGSVVMSIQVNTGFSQPPKENEKIIDIEALNDENLE